MPIPPDMIMTGRHGYAVKDANGTIIAWTISLHLGAASFPDSSLINVQNGTEVQPSI